MYALYEARYEKEPSKNTSRNHHCALNSFFTYLERLDHVKSNPLRKLDPPKGERKANDYLSPEEDERLICAPVTPRERIIIAWLRYTGMRADVEATKVKQRDVDLTPTADYPWGRIIVKNSKTPRGRRVIPIFPELRVEIDRWYEFLRKLELRDLDLPVLVTAKRTPMTHDYLWRIVKRVAHRAEVRVTRCACGTEKPARHEKGCPRSTNGKNLSEVTPHSLRRTFGSALRQEGKSIDSISKALGHSDSRTTEQHYVDLEDATVAREILSTA